MIPRTPKLSALSLGLAACAGDAPVEPETPLPQVEILGTVGSMVRDIEVQMEAAIPGHPGAQILWSVSDAAMASISATGLLRTPRCAPLGEFNVIATWAEHPQQQATRRISLVTLLVEPFFVRSISDAATGATIDINDVHGVVEVEMGMPDECTPAERIALLAIAGNQETLLTSVAVESQVPRAQRTVRLRWDSSTIPNGNYQIGGEALATSSRLRSSGFTPIRVTNPQP